MALDFPDTPTVGATYTAGGLSWTWDGTKWAATGAGTPGLYLPLTGGTMSGVLTANPGLNSSNVNLTGGSISSAVNLLALRGFISGLGTAWVDNTHISVAPGTAMSDDNTTIMTLPATLTKTLAAWAAGNGGMLDTGALAQTWYNIYLIYNPTTQVTDVLASTSLTAPTMPSGYTKKRRVWTIATGVSPFNITQYTQVGDDCIWYIPFTAINGQISSSAPTQLGTYTPSGLNCEAELSVQYNGAAVGTFYLWPTYAGSASAVLVNPVASTYVASVVRVMSNNAAAPVCNIQAGSATNTTIIQARGYRDTRGRFN